MQLRVGVRQMYNAGMWDTFISHASEDKLEVVLPLASELDLYAFDCWVDRFELKPGDSLRQKIDEGLRLSRMAVVVLSEWFFRKAWPQAELDALFAMMLNSDRPLFPIWHQMNARRVTELTPLMSGRVAARTDQGIAEVANQVARQLGARGLPLFISVDLSTCEIVETQAMLENLIRESGDIAGGYSKRRIEVTFLNGPRREEREIARGIRVLLTCEPLTFRVRTSDLLALTLKSFVRQYDYGRSEKIAGKLDVWRTDDSSWYVGITLTAEELEAVNSIIGKQLEFTRGPQGLAYELPADFIATKLIPQLLFRTFRKSAAESNRYSDLLPYLSLAEWQFGPG